MLTPSSWFVDDEQDPAATAAETTGDGITALDRNIPRLDPCEEWKLINAELEYLVVTDRSKWSEDQHKISDYWDRYVARNHPRTSVADLSELHEMYPRARPRDFLQTMAYNFDGWQRMRDTFDHLNTTVCVTVEAGYASSASFGSSELVEGPVNSSNPLRRRFIQPDIDGEPFWQYQDDPYGEIPTLGTIFAGIFNSLFISIRTICTIADTILRPHYFALREVGLLGRRSSRSTIWVSSISFVVLLNC